MTQTIYFNATVLTVDDTDNVATTVLTDDGTIVSVGAFDEIERRASEGAQRRDLSRRTLIPAFIDPHGHFPDSGYLGRLRADLSAPPIGNCKTLGDVFSRLSDLASKTPEGEWVIGSLFEPSALAENRFPTRLELDRVSTKHPIWVIHFTGHAGVGNSRALAARGVTRDTPDFAGGWIGRDSVTGDLNGMLKGMAAMGELGDSEFQVTFERFREAYVAAAREYFEHGVALAQNAWATEELLAYFLRIDAENSADIECMVLPAGHLEPALSDGRLDLPPQNPAGRIMLGPRKLFGDGSFHIQTACITEPYFKPFNGDPGFRCPPSITREDMAKKIGHLHCAGFQVHIHSNGDATSDILLDALEDVLEADPRNDHRHTLIHAQILREDQLDRMARLGVTASFFPAHLYYWGNFHRDITFGPDRVRNMCPTRWAADRGIRFTIHNDAQVTPTRPLHLMWCAVNRTSATGSVLGPEQALTPREALRAHTIDAAWQVFLERERGSIEPGKRADFAILSRNPLNDPAGLRDIKVEETIVNGKTVYQRERTLT
ncbi:amidohydrolase [Pseudohalocynthiibacter aestuariivivens]|jgi:predicted amidohydrolase YtcJ|uniref:Amidohydrolase n=1 Tax=Pseudohalocynthiibacter aestuariivivens TaxID=1591409 RepID=A0ABV5JJX9_9RHOB|nr:MULTISPECIES: amidohydrolase [Pseudohalocynthiibacter]MBS9718999.1 amidohydrolase [Pseudohalocynthiibacter aestuariivivens]MCK0104576.1 amidohydrolase [Pseudohalocynthiibacter sp. F2068]